SELSSGMKTQAGKIMGTFSFYGLALDVGVNLDQAARMTGELGMAWSSVVSSFTSIKEHEQDE
ncbi:MAG TPA: hypothetical protein VN181_16850, partial [Thermoanaerobaculia bacterium]|nr:hypothetical protein [Thermoanaerobaculia bacterium]